VMLRALATFCAVVLAVVPLPVSPALAAMPTDVTATAAAATPQFRALWVDAFGDGIFTEAQIDELVTYTKGANLNAIVAQVVRRGDSSRASSRITTSTG